MRWYASLARPRVPDYALHQIVWSYLPSDYRHDGSERPLKAPGNRVIHWPQCDMRGTLRVTDRAAFLQRLPAGIWGAAHWGMDCCVCRR